MDILTYQLPKSDRIEDIRQALRDLEAYALKGSKALGRARWLQGEALLSARKQCKKRGDWTAFLASVEIKDKSAFLLRKIATVVPEKRSYEMGYDDMLGLVYDSFKKATIKQNLNEATRNETFVDDDPADSSQDEKTDGNSGNKTFTIKSLRSRLMQVTKTMRTLRDCKLVDSPLNPSELPTFYADTIRLAEQVGADALRVKEKLSKKHEAFRKLSVVKPAIGAA